MDSHACDLLVLGAGLAGCRAAWAAQEESPKLRVTLVSAFTGPSGSSFANANQRLGMQVCADESEIQDFIRETLALAAPGQADPELVEILARESLDCFQDLKHLGAPYRRTTDGDPDRLSACFSPHSRRSVILEPLDQLFRSFHTKLTELGVEFLPGYLVRDILTDPGSGRALCTILHNTQTGQQLAVNARAVILALGGPAPVFAQSLAGPGNPGYALALLARTGARLVNTPFLQFFWSRLPSRRFQALGPLLLPEGARVENKERGAPQVLPPNLRGLLPERDTHCPMAHGRPDRAVDDFLLARMRNGVLRVRNTAGQSLELGLLAQAGNGGALVDAQGSTTTPGLFACGECASGMHGANRLGGAMVAATQVFGRRAGLSAAQDPPPEPSPHELHQTLSSQKSRPDSRPPGSDQGWLAQALQKHFPGDNAALRHDLKSRLQNADDWLSRRLLETAILLTRVGTDNLGRNP